MAHFHPTQLDAVTGFPLSRPESETQAAFRELDERITSFSPSLSPTKVFQEYWDNLLSSANRLESERMVKAGTSETSVGKFISNGWAVFENRELSDSGRLEPTKFVRKRPPEYQLAIPVLLLFSQGRWRLAGSLELALIHHPTLRALAEEKGWKPGSALSHVRRIVDDAAYHRPSFADAPNVVNDTERDALQDTTQIWLLAEQLKNRIAPEAWKASTAASEPFWALLRDALELGKLLGEHSIVSDPDFVSLHKRAEAMRSGSLSKDPWLTRIRTIQDELPKPLSVVKFLKHVQAHEDYRTQRISFPESSPFFGLGDIDSVALRNKIKGDRERRRRRAGRG